MLLVNPNEPSRGPYIEATVFPDGDLLLGRILPAATSVAPPRLSMALRPVWRSRWWFGGARHPAGEPGNPC